MIEKTYEDVKDDPCFLVIEREGFIENWFMDNWGKESWGQTCFRMTQEGIPCKFFWSNHYSDKGILFDSAKQKLEFILRCK